MGLRESKGGQTTRTIWRVLVGGGAILVGLGVVSTYSFTRLGPIPLEDAAHMTAYLAGGVWERHDGPEQRWSFSEDGTFSASGEIGEFFADAPPDTQVVTGMWVADVETLSLTAIHTADGLALPDRTLPLGWIDGKLRIEIGRSHYLR